MLPLLLSQKQGEQVIHQNKYKMKTNNINHRQLKKQIYLFAITMFLFLLVLLKSATAQPGDPYFPAKRKFHAGLLTTYSGVNPPPVFIADVTYGVSRKLSIGIVGGTTGTLALYAFRLNTLLFQENDFRILFRMSTIYYPKRDGTFLFDKRDKYVMPWMLSMGLIDAEWRTQKGFRWSLGMGIIETHCVDDMKMWFSKSHFQHEAGPEIFNTVQGGVSIPISKRFLIHPEVIVAMKGVHLVEQGKFKVTFPINPYLNFIYCF